MGLYKQTITSSSATGAANTPTTLASLNVPGGSVADGDGLRLSLRLDATFGAGSACVKLGNVVLIDTIPLGQGMTANLGVSVVRKGATLGLIVGAYYEDQYGRSLLLTAERSGFSWTSAQALQVIAQSETEGGVVLQYATVER